jgi:aminoglycoside phosphotransferase (APT) family kinase protein
MSWLKRQILRFLRLVCPSMIRKTEIRDYILRIPRNEHAWIGHEVAILKLLATTSVPVPRIRTFSLSAENPIGNLYMIQPRLPGKSDFEVHLKLNTQQRICFALDLGSALKEMGNIQLPSLGNLDPDAFLAGPSNVQILRLHCPLRNAFRHVQSIEPFVSSTPQTVYEFFMSQFARQRAHDPTLHREYLNPWRLFTAIIQHLHRLGYLNENSYVSTHMDSEPRNILIYITSPTTAHLSAILDWDETVFAPAFTNCRPPFWRWHTGDDGEEELDEAAATVTPKNADLAAVKKAFEEAAGDKYCKWAFTAEYRLARDIAKLAIMGVCSNDGYDTARRVVREWNEMHTQTELEVCRIFDDEEDE